MKSKKDILFGQEHFKSVSFHFPLCPVHGCDIVPARVSFFSRWVSVLKQV